MRISPLMPIDTRPPEKQPTSHTTGEAATKQRWEKSRRMIRSLKMRIKAEIEDMNNKLKLSLEGITDDDGIEDIKEIFLDDIEKSSGKLWDV